jgi:hypothetical protein
MSLPANPYLNLISNSLRSMRADVPRLTELGERMAEPLLRGGGLFTPQIGTFWPSEFGGRAGGLMGLKPSDYVAQSPHDVAFTTLPDSRRWKPKEDPRWQKLIESKAQIFIVGRPEEISASSAGAMDRFAGFTGGVGAEEGFGASAALPSLKPIAPLRPFEQLVRGWLTTGEMVGACTRAGKMPILWMSVWLEGAMVRNATFFKHHNVREPWYCPLFHETIYIPPISAGSIADAFLSELERLFGIIVAQGQKLALAGQWMSAAARAKKQISTVLVGHSYPEILEIADPGTYPITWLPSISDLQKAHPSDLGEGDVALHLGYSPVDVPDVQRILDRGIKFIYTSPYGRPDNLKDHPNLIWLDLPWRPGDATVDIPGYSVRLLPMSSSVHTIVYFALLSEMANRSAPAR